MGGSGSTLNVDVDLITASLGGNDERVRSLLHEGGANANCMDMDADTPLHAAAQGGYCEVIRLLLDYGADVSRCDAAGWTPLHFAAFWGHIDAVRLLVGSGARPRVFASDGSTPADVARVKGFAEVAEMLERLAGTGESIARSNDSGKGNNNKTRNTRNKDGYQLTDDPDADIARDLADDSEEAEKRRKQSKELRVACGYGRLPRVRELLDLGADGNARDPSNGQTAMHFAAKDGNANIVQLLVDAGVRRDVADLRGATPLKLAQQSKHRDVIVLLRPGM